MVTKTIHVCSVIEENLSRGFVELNTLSLNVLLNIDYVMICLADRGHPFNSFTGDGKPDPTSVLYANSLVCLDAKVKLG